MAMYIGDVWVDEVTSLGYNTYQTKRPIYGYASELFDGVARGTFLVQGQFTINFKEAGYLFLVLERYKKMQGLPGLMDLNTKRNTVIGTSPFDSNAENKDMVSRQNIEQIINGEMSTFNRNRALMNLATNISNPTPLNQQFRTEERRRTAASLGGFASESRRRAQRGDGRSLGSAEEQFETFEDLIWQKPIGEIEKEHRRCDDNYLNPFDIYVTYGDFAGSDYDNHTMIRLSDVHIVGTGQQVEISGRPLQELYQFFGRNRI
jgi:hypothetical protein